MMMRETKSGENSSGFGRLGFTLIEIMAVMVIIGTVAVFTIPSIYSLLSTTELNAGSRDLSNHLVLARSEAITRQTLTRFVVATGWTETEGILRRYSIWRWNPETSEFDQVTKWYRLPEGVIFEPERPAYLNRSAYAKNDATTVAGEFALSQEEASFQTQVDGYPVETRFVEFLPTGAARIPGGTSKNIIFSLVEGYLEAGPSGLNLVRTHTGPGGDSANWAQINLETLTGRVRIYRP